MPRLHSFFLPLAAFTVILMSGALSLQSRSSPPKARPEARCGFFETASHAAGEHISDPAQVFDAALAILRPDNLEWLETTFWVRGWDDEFSFTASGNLLLGPNQCARLETSLESEGGKGHVLVVSDGAVLAHVLRLPGQAEQITMEKFAAPESPAERKALLVRKGCGGPGHVLAELRSHMKNLRAAVGVLDGIAVVRLGGDMDATVPDHLRLPRPATECYVYLDRKSLLPLRIEWCNDQSVIADLEFRDLRLNRALGHDDCVQAFTFQPK